MSSPLNKLKKIQEGYTTAQERAEEIRNQQYRFALRKTLKEDIEKLAKATAKQSMQIGIDMRQFRTRGQAKDHYNKVEREEKRILTKAFESKNGEDIFERARAAAMQSMKYGVQTRQFRSEEQARDHYMKVYLEEINIAINKNTNKNLRNFYSRKNTRANNAAKQAAAAEAAAASLAPPRKAELEDLREAWFENDKGMSFEKYVEAAGLRLPPSNAEMEDLREAWFENGKGMSFENYVQRHRKGGRRRKTRRTRR